MGQKTVKADHQQQDLRVFTRRLLADLQALEQMLEEGRIEGGPLRIGAEQELFLVDGDWRPAPLAPAILAELADPHATSELGRFNLELNLDPLVMEGDCLARLEAQLRDLLERTRRAAARHGAEAILTGILPTLDKADLTLENMSPEPRYRALNDALTSLRGERYQIRIKGSDELYLAHDNIMVEACNASFQVHFQVAPADFAARYNAAQAVAGPVLAAAANSPLLFGKRLWRETRIALFQQSIDTRTPSAHLREQRPRVSFGQGWVADSILEIYREDVARFRVLVAGGEEEDPFIALGAGRPPSLAALCLHNSTVYRWNRPCYGISEGRPHLRIENRILPAGPTVVDEVANAAFWFGLIRGVTDRYGDIARTMPFDDAKENFQAAARLDLAAQFAWPERGSLPAGELILGELLPLARQGLLAMTIRPGDADRYLGVLEERVRSGRTGAQWLLDSYAGLGEEGGRLERLSVLVAAAAARQRRGEPVHAWPLARPDETGGGKPPRTVGQVMTTELFTVHEDELVDLVAHIMHWQHIRHVPVEDQEHRLVGLVTPRSLLRLVRNDLGTPAGGADEPIPVRSIMEREVVTVGPDAPGREAVDLMRRRGIGCLPVVDGERRLVGIVTERDFPDRASPLLASLEDGDGQRGG